MEKDHGPPPPGVNPLQVNNYKSLQDRVALGVKLEDEMELPAIKWKNYRHSAKAGLGQASISFKGRKEKALGMNGEYSLIAGKKEEHQVTHPVPFSCYLDQGSLPKFASWISRPT